MSKYPPSDAWWVRATHYTEEADLSDTTPLCESCGEHHPADLPCYPQCERCGIHHRPGADCIDAMKDKLAQACIDKDQADRWVRRVKTLEARLDKIACVARGEGNTAAVRADDEIAGLRQSLDRTVVRAHEAENAVTGAAVVLWDVFRDADLCTDDVVGYARLAAREIKRWRKAHGGRREP